MKGTASGSSGARLGDQRIALQPPLPGHGADPQAAVLAAADEVELRQRLRSTRSAGCASRKFITGIRLCPPASSLASPPWRARSVQRGVQRVGRQVLERSGLHRRASSLPRCGPADSNSRGRWLGL